MRSAVQDVSQASPADERITIDVGCGSSRHKDARFGVDLLPAKFVSVVCDVNRGIPFRAGTVDAVYSSHFLEHVDDLEKTLLEFCRVLKPGGMLHVTVPHFSNPLGYSDYTHKRFFGYYSFDYFAETPARYGATPRYSNRIRLRIHEKRLCFKQWPLVGTLVEKLLARSELAAYVYESRLAWLLPCFEVQFRMEVLPAQREAAAGAQARPLPQGGARDAPSS